MRLEARGVSFRYRASSPEILTEVSFHVDEGERVGVIAPSGYGKTTLLKLLAGYLHPSEGQILLNAAPLARGALPIQLINQHPEEAINPRWRMARALAEAGEVRPDVLGSLGIRDTWLTRYPRELSGGELQRFNVARALLAEASFLLADEISTMLDPLTQAQIWRYLLAETKRRGTGLVVVTHNEHLARRVCTRIVDLRVINAAAGAPALAGAGVRY